MSQSIDIPRVTTAGNAIKTANTNIDNAFRTPQNAMEQLSSSWQGPAGTAVQTVIQELFKFNEARSEVVGNYSRALLELINPSYEGVEMANTNLADLFK